LLALAQQNVPPFREGTFMSAPERTYIGERIITLGQPAPREGGAGNFGICIRATPDDLSRRARLGC
jgi:hypothetical protein